jgi:hypothetical protein
MSPRLSRYARERLRRPLWQLREGAKRLGHRWQRGYVPLSEMQALSPVFIIGGNRSGTSIVSSILAQNTGLEGLFGGGTESEYNAAGHSLGFCESMHLWYHLWGGERMYCGNAHHPFWALPQYIWRYVPMVRPKRRGAPPPGVGHRAAQAHRSPPPHQGPVQYPARRANCRRLSEGQVPVGHPVAAGFRAAGITQMGHRRELHRLVAAARELSVAHGQSGGSLRPRDLCARTVHDSVARRAACRADRTREQFARVTSALSLPPHDYDFAKIAKHWTPREGTVSSDDASLTDVPRIIESERRVLAELHRQPATA